MMGAKIRRPLHGKSMTKYRWLKFRVTEEEYKDAKKTFTDSGERWFWRWCQKLFSKGVSEQRMKDFKP